MQTTRGFDPCDEVEPKAIRLVALDNRDNRVWPLGLGDLHGASPLFLPESLASDKARPPRGRCGPNRPAAAARPQLLR